MQNTSKSEETRSIATIRAERALRSILIKAGVLERDTEMSGVELATAAEMYASSVPSANLPVTVRDGKKHAITLSISEDDDDLLDKKSRIYGISRSQYVSTLIRGELPSPTRTSLSVLLERDEVLYLATLFRERITDPGVVGRALASNFAMLAEQIHLSCGTDPAKLHPCPVSTLLDDVSIPCILAEGHKGKHKSEGGKRAITWPTPALTSKEEP